MAILERNAAVLAKEIEDGIKLLEEETPRVFLIGGLMKQADLLLPLIQKHLQINCRLCVFTDSLAKGALILAGWEDS